MDNERMLQDEQLIKQITGYVSGTRLPYWGLDVFGSSVTYMSVSDLEDEWRWKPVQIREIVLN